MKKSNFNDRAWKLFHKTENQLLDALWRGTVFFAAIYLLNYILK